MNILYITTTRYPKNKTNYFQTLVMANEFSAFGKVVFITQNPIADSVFIDYGIKKNEALHIKTIPFERFIQKILFVLHLLLLVFGGNSILLIAGKNGFCVF